MPFTPQELKEYRKKIRLEGKCTRCHRPLIDGAFAGKYICVNCTSETTRNKHLRRNFNGDN